MSFEWDEDKRQLNIQKHGIDFVDVVHIFDHDVFTIEDTRFQYDEPRYWAWGLLGMKAILVIYTYRDNVIRIISARKATKNEQKQFFS
ncbi:MAG: BrnT family toxin [Chloroflexi bacterium]|nr:BrnT family toxin [Chloroflexota bacterium]